MVLRRRLLLTAACRLCGSTRFRKDAVAIECVGCGAIRPRKPGDEPLVAAMAGWEECPLSPRELETLHELFAGKSYKQAALAMGLSQSTVRTHLASTYKKLGLPGAVQACLVAYERGWFRSDEKGTNERSR